MADPPADPPTTPAADLGRSYGEMLSPSAWEVEVGDPGVPGTPAEAVATAPPPVRRIVEALLFVGGVPLTAARAAQAVRGLTTAQLTEAIDALNQDYRQQGRPYTIQAHEHGYVLVLRPAFRLVV
jgi:hypothetical protein